VKLMSQTPRPDGIWLVCDISFILCSLAADQRLMPLTDDLGQAYDIGKRQDGALR
jgi:hypothetical protein